MPDLNLLWLFALQYLYNKNKTVLLFNIWQLLGVKFDHRDMLLRPKNVTEGLDEFIIESLFAIELH